MNEVHFRAPWSVSLWVISLGATLILAAAGVGGALLLTEPPASVKALLGGVIFLTLAVNALFTVRGYALGNEALYVKRLLWWTEIGLDGLQSVVVDRDACRRSIRLFGNGGLFAFAGLFRNKKLGRYRLCGTDLKRAVVLKFSDRTWVITPHNPEDFARQVKRIAGLQPRRPDRSA
jgi:hypothetical protein